MKFSINKNILFENLHYVTKAISPKNIIPVLNGIKFELTKKGLELTASNSELIVQTLIPKKEINNFEQEGIVIIQSNNILDIIRKLPEEIINIELVEDNKILIYTDKSKYYLNCLNKEDYPLIKFEEAETPVILNGDLLKQIINQTSFAISTQESRPLLTGINIKINGNIFDCIATDSYRLAKKTIKLETMVNDLINIVIPGENIKKIIEIINDDQPVEMHIFNNKIIFKYKNIMFKSNLLNGTYPDITNLIPTEFEIIINANLNDFYNSIDRASLLTPNKDRNTVKMLTSKDNLFVTSLSSEYGKVEDVITVEKNKSKDIEISFSSKYMLEALKSFDDLNILILLNSDVKPIIIKSETDETLIQLILPIKTY